MGKRGSVLLINPWVYDFAAHNLWIEPLGLLTIAAALRESGFGVSVIDCLAPFPGSPRARPDGSGKLHKIRLGSPEALAFVPRRYGRYGMPIEAFDESLSRAARPDVVLVASGMTYWYPGVQEVIRRVRSHLGAVPVALGGVYASLCPDHARQHSGADRVIVGPGVMAGLEFADAVVGGDSEPRRFSDPQFWPAPAHELIPRPHAGVLTSWGCPFQCSYCASHILHPSSARRKVEDVVDEVSVCARRGIQDIAFYDDALLVRSERHFVRILSRLEGREIQVRFHTPNGLHARLVTPEVAEWMRRARFGEVRLSLESSSKPRQTTTGGKVSTADFERAVVHLCSAGFSRAQITAYLLAGLPGQSLAEVEASACYVHAMGLRARLALFSPIPGTADGNRSLPPGIDPLFHNNTVFPYWMGDGYVAELRRLQRIINEGNAALARDGG